MDAVIKVGEEGAVIPHISEVVLDTANWKVKLHMTNGNLVVKKCASQADVGKYAAHVKRSIDAWYASRAHTVPSARIVVLPDHTARRAEDIAAIYLQHDDNPTEPAVEIVVELLDKTKYFFACRTEAIGREVLEEFVDAWVCGRYVENVVQDGEPDEHGGYWKVEDAA